MPHAVCYNSPVGEMEPRQVSVMKLAVAGAMAQVDGSAIEARQLRLSTPVEPKPVGIDYQPFLHVKLRRETLEELARTPETITAMCEAGARVLHEWFKDLGFPTDTVQYNWNDGTNTGRGQYPKKV